MNPVSPITPENAEATLPAQASVDGKSAVHHLDATLEACLSRHWGRLCAIIAYRCSATLLESCSIEDLAHEVVVEALKHRDGFVYRGERAFTRWMATLARRVVSAWARENARGMPTVPLTRTSDGGPLAVPISHLAGPDSTPSSCVARNQEMEQLRDALAALSPKDRDAIVMVKLEGRSIAECALALDCSYQAVAQRLAHGLRELTRVLEGVST